MRRREVVDIAAKKSKGRTVMNAAFSRTDRRTAQKNAANAARRARRAA